jgi:hypothetical protein
MKSRTEHGIYSGVKNLIDGIIDQQELVKETSFSTFAVLDYCQRKKKEVVAVIMQGDQLIEASYKKVPVEEDTLGFKDPMMRHLCGVKTGIQEKFDFIEWDGSSESVVSNIMNKYKTVDVIIGTIPKTANVKSSLATFYHMYNSHTLVKEWFKEKEHGQR